MIALVELLEKHQPGPAGAAAEAFAGLAMAEMAAEADAAATDYPAATAYPAATTTPAATAHPAATATEATRQNKKAGEHLEDEADFSP